MLKSKLYLYFICASAFLLNACSSGIEETDFSKLTPEQRIEKISKISELKENNKIALFSTKTNSRLAVNSVYHYKNKAFSLEFLGPMGMRYAKLDVLANGTTYLDVQGRNFNGDNARALLKEQFNLDIPVEKLPDIMFGIPDGKCSYDTHGYVNKATLSEGYEVAYKQYKTFKGGVVLPSDIEIIAPNNKVLIKVNSVTTLN
ncbi:lipoprotein insertase outer membrane protein LolB [Succinivibrio sp.]|uniref:lipoprotein insertase outer membrane protein LolB n=1 Tax=Succinivibrio sp. TaxID=2053619 RepID=UPI003869490D